MNFFNELKRRNVFKVAAAYVIVGWLIMQAGYTLAPALLLPELINSVLAFFLILGFPLALFFAWAYEMTPEGIKKEKEVDRSQSITQGTGQKLNYSIIALLVAALAYFTYDKFLVQPRSADVSSAVSNEPVETEQNEYQTIAVLPFVNMSDDSSNEYFSDGLTEELLNILAKIKELRVAGRTSSFAFKGKDEDLRLIGEKLNVKTILEGSVRKDDKRNRIRITAQLINVADGYHLWSETYDRELDDIFAIQDEIAREVARALRITLLGEDEERLEQVTSTEISAYELYLQAMQGLHEGSFVSLDRAARQFQQALALDPAFIPAKLGLINTWSELANTGAITRQEALNRGLPLLETVVAEQPDNSDAGIQMALFSYYAEDNRGAEAAFIAALEADPRNARGLQEFGRFLFDNGQVARGMELIDAALEIEPYAVRVLWDHCQTNGIMQEISTALSSCARIREIVPDSPLGWYGWGSTYMFNGDIARGMKGYSEAIELDPNDYEMVAAMGLFWVLLGDTEQADKWQQRADAIGAGQPVPVWSRLMLYQYREQHDLAKKLAGQVLERKIEDRYGTNTIFRQTWAYESARTGNYQAALKPFQHALPWAFEDLLVLPPNVAGHIGDLLQIAALLKLTDPTSERPSQLLEVVENMGDQQNPRRGFWGTDLDNAAVATIRGDNETALKWLNSAWDKKLRLGWRLILLNNAVFIPLKNEPGYRDLAARFEADMDRQRDVAYELMEIQK
jgi:TolB-like protein/tetratricopeptide (TPR) repeat protein